MMHRIVTILAQGGGPFTPVPRAYRGNMCGVRVMGIQPVPGGASDPTLVLDWFYDRSDQIDRSFIRGVWREKGVVDVLVSWPDSQQMGYSPQQFVGTCRELISYGFQPCVMLSAKPTGSGDVRDIQGTLDNIMLVLPLLRGVVGRVCVGWELSLWLSPSDVQFLIDQIAPVMNPAGCKVYVHFQSGYFAFQQPGHDTGDFWRANVGKLTGILHQRDFNEDKGNPGEYRARIVDCLQRFAGEDNCPAESGFGHPFDFIALEITAELQFNGQVNEAVGDLWGTVALSTPPFKGVMVMGSGNGQI